MSFNRYLITFLDESNYATFDSASDRVTKDELAIFVKLPQLHPQALGPSKGIAE